MNSKFSPVGSLLIVAISILSFNAVSQVENWCGTAQKMNEMMSDPAMLEIFQQDEEIRQYESSHPMNLPKNALYKIPIVFHVLHNGGPENVSEAQIMNALEVINRDFNKQNADTAEVIPLFQPIIADVQFEFVLATKAPNGECFRGYTRTQSPLTFEGEDGDAQVDAVRFGNDVFQGNWPSNKYLNVYVIADAGGAGGYTNYPWGSSTDMSRGIWILHTQFGEIGTSGISAGRSLTHEIGHWFNLPHTWGNSNSPGQPNNCSTDDGVTDTPLCIGVSGGGCPTSQDDCGPIANVQNYMDYALGCQSMFTNGQSDRMHTAIQSSVGNRNNLWTVQNLADTGTDGDLELCEADFQVNKRVVCAGNSVQFDDLSYSVATEWNWSFPGGTPAASSDENPSITYNTPGVYEVVLEAGDGVSTDTETKTAYITVLTEPGTLPFFDGFEDYSSLTNNQNWMVYNPDNNATWTLTTTAAHTGNKSVKLSNFGQSGQYYDELEASSVDLSGATVGNTVFSFRHAYRRTASNNQEYLKVHFTADCGDNWFVKRTLSSAQLSTGANYETTSWTPSSQADWKTVHVEMNNSSYEMFMVENFRYKFSFDSKVGNNIFLDDINIYEGVASDTLVNSLGVESTELVNNLVLYPNPVQEDLSIDFTVVTDQNLEISIVDLSGKQLNKIVIHAKAGQNLVVLGTEELLAGMYLVAIKGTGSTRTMRFIKE